jgi:hypothetical protein
MRALLLSVACVLGLAAAPLEASHGHRVIARPYVGIGFGYGYPFGFYDPFYSPWYGPRFGVGVHVDRHPVRRTRSATVERGEQRSLKLYVYPAAGQSEAQTAEDRYQCHVWAADQSGHDPTLGAGTREDADSYTRAFAACMEARSYVVK